MLKTTSDVATAFNAAINFAIDLSFEADIFLRMWREGDWAEIEKEFPEFLGPRPSDLSVSECSFEVIKNSFLTKFIGSSDIAVLGRFFADKVTLITSSECVIPLSQIDPIIRDILNWRVENTTTRFEIKQQVRTVDKAWLEVISSTTSENAARSGYSALIKEHPTEYFELVRIRDTQECLAFTPKFS